MFIKEVPSMKNLVLVLALMLSATITAPAQTSAIRSRIVDTDGMGVPDVMITEMSRCASSLPPFEATDMKTYVTDANGFFTWPQSAPSGTGSLCASTVIYGFSLSKAGYTFTRGSFGYKPGPAALPSPPPFDTRLPLIYASTAPVWTSVSAASFENPLTGGMIAAGYGTGLAEFTESAGAVLPESLANRRILVKDSAGVERPARLFFVSPSQINYVIPEGLQEGNAG